MLNHDQMSETMRLVKQSLDEEYKRNEAIVKRAEEIETIVVLAIASCHSHSPMLANMLLAKAEQIFGKKLEL